MIPRREKKENQIRNSKKRIQRNSGENQDNGGKDNIREITGNFPKPKHMNF